MVGPKDFLPAAYTVDDGSSLIPFADPLFASNEVLRSQIASLQQTHVFSPNLLNTARVGFSRAACDYNSYSVTTLPASLDFERRRRGRHRDRRWRQYHRGGGPHFGGP